MSVPPLLSISGLRVAFAGHDGWVEAVRGVDLEIRAGEVVAVVGESGCGKTLTLSAVLGLLPPGARATGSVRFRGEEILGAPESRLRLLRGGEIGLVFQDPMTAMNPFLRVGRQLSEVLEVHRGTSRREGQAAALAMMRRVGIPDADRRLRSWPHEFSGGMRQRAMVAAALMASPSLLLADEPTTALDATIQAQVLDLLDGLRRDLGLAIVLVTHNLGVVARLADRVAVMYAGEIVEEGAMRPLLRTPAHPYTRALLAAVPRLDAPPGSLPTALRGAPPAPTARTAGCAFSPRCERASPVCATIPAMGMAIGRRVRCHMPVQS